MVIIDMQLSIDQNVFGTEIIVLQHGDTLLIQIPQFKSQLLVSDMMELPELNQDLLKLLIILFMKLVSGKNRVHSISKLNPVQITLQVTFSSMDQEQELILMMVLEEIVHQQKTYFSILAENLEIMVHLIVGIDNLMSQILIRFLEENNGMRLKTISLLLIITDKKLQIMMTVQLITILIIISWFIVEME